MQPLSFSIRHQERGVLCAQDRNDVLLYSCCHLTEDAGENGGVLCRNKRKQMRPFKSNDLEMLYVFFCLTEHKFASEKRGMPKLR